MKVMKTISTGFYMSVDDDIEAFGDKIVYLFDELQRQYESKSVMEDGIDRITTKCCKLEERLMCREEKAQRLEEVIEESRNISRALEKERDQLQLEMMDLRQRREEKEGFMEEECRELRQLETVLKAQFCGAHADGESVLEAVTARFEELQKKCDELTVDLETICKKTEERDTNKSEIDCQTDLKSTFNETFSILTDILKKFEIRDVNLEHDAVLCALETKFGGLNLQIWDLTQEKEKLQMEMDILRENNETERLNNLIGLLEKELKSEKKKSEESFMELSREYEDLQKKIELGRTDYSKKIGILKNRVEELENEKSELLSELNIEQTLDSVYDDIKSKFGKLQEKYDELTVENVDLTAKLTSLNDVEDAVANLSTCECQTDLETDTADKESFFTNLLEKLELKDVAKNFEAVSCAIEDRYYALMMQISELSERTESNLEKSAMEAFIQTENDFENGQEAEVERLKKYTLLLEEKVTNLQIEITGEISSREIAQKNEQLFQQIVALEKTFEVEKNQLMLEISTTEEKIEKLTRENENLWSDLDKKKSEFNTTVDETRHEVEGLRSRLSVLNQERVELIALFDMDKDVEEIVENDKFVNEIRKTLDALKQKGKHAQMETELLLSKTETDFVEKSKIFTDLLERFGIKEVELTFEAVLDALQSKFCDLEKQMSDLLNKNDSFVKEIGFMEKNNSEMAEKSGKLLNKIEELEMNLELAQGRSKEDEDAQVELEHQKLEYKEKYEESIQEVGRLKIKLSELDAERVRLMGKFDVDESDVVSAIEIKMELMHKEKDSLVEKIVTLEEEARAVGELVHLELGMDKDNEFIEMAEQITMRLVKDYRAVKTVLAELTECVGVDKSMLLQRVSEVLEEARMMRESFGMERESLLADADRKISELQLKLTLAEKGATRSDLMTLEMDQIDRAMANLQAQVVQKTEAVAELEKQLAEMARQTTEARDRVRKLEAGQAHLEGRDARMKQLLVRTKKELTEAREGLATACSEQERATERLEETKLSLESALVQRQRSEETVRRLESGLRTKESVTVGLRKQLEGTNAARSALIREYEDYKVKVQAVFNSQKSKSTFSNFMAPEESQHGGKSESGMATYLSESSSSALKESQRQLSDLNTMLDDVRTELQLAEDNNSMLSSQLSRLQESNETLHERIRLLTKECADMSCKLQYQQDAAASQQQSHNELMQGLLDERDKNSKNQLQQFDISRSDFDQQLDGMRQKLDAVELNKRMAEQELFRTQERLRAAESKLALSVSNATLDHNAKILAWNNVIPVLPDQERQQGEGMEANHDQYNTPEASPSNLFHSPLLPAHRRESGSKHKNTLIPLDQLLADFGPAPEAEAEATARKLDLQSQQLRDRELAVAAYREQLTMATEQLADSDSTVLRLSEQSEILKSEIRRLESNEERQAQLCDNASFEYLKNVLLKFVNVLSSQDERQQLVPVLVTLLRLGDAERGVLVRFVAVATFPSPSTNSTEHDGSGGGGWTNYLTGWTRLS